MILYVALSLLTFILHMIRIFDICLNGNFFLTDLLFLFGHSKSTSIYNVTIWPTEKAKNQFLGSIELMSPKVHPMSPIIFNSDSIYVGKWCAESVSKEYLPNSLKRVFSSWWLISLVHLISYKCIIMYPHRNTIQYNICITKKFVLYTHFTKCSLLYQKKYWKKKDKL